MASSTSSVPAPTLVNVAVPETELSTAVPPKLRTVGEASSLAAPVCPVPESENWTLAPVLVVAVRVAARGPVFAGLKRIGIDSFWPVLSWAGSGGERTSNSLGALLRMLSTSTSSSAVSVSVLSELEPSVVAGNSTGAPLRGCLTGEPNPSTRPSRVPT